jgi:hypothetical protein
VYVFAKESLFATSLRQLQDLFVFFIHRSESVLAVLLVEHARWECGAVLQVLLNCFLVVIQFDLFEQQFLVLLSPE